MTGNPEAKFNPEAQEVKPKTAPEILDGRDAINLLVAEREFRLNNGIEVVAGTDKGVGRDGANEDRILVAPEENFLAVIDGMGGYGNGDLAAQYIAEEFSKNPKDLDNAALDAVKRIKETNIDPNAGGVFVSALIHLSPEGKYLADFAMAGDSRIVVLDSNRNVKFVSEDHSPVAMLVRIGKLDADEALYHSSRHVVQNPISQQQFTIDHVQFELAEGDMILMMSDGIADNFTPEEIAEMAKERKAPETYKYIALQSQQRMENKEFIKLKTGDRRKVKTYIDGFRSEPKGDNRALAVLEIPKEA